MAICVPKINVGDRFGQAEIVAYVGKKFSGGCNRNIWACLCLKCGKVRNMWQSNILCKDARIQCFECARWKGVGEMSGQKWSHIIANAKVRGIAVEITKEEAYQIFLDQERLCALSGVEINFSKRGKANTYKGTASLDRIDNKDIYRCGNVQWIHKDLQQLKWDMPEDRLFSWCIKIVQHRCAERFDESRIK